MFRLDGGSDPGWLRDAANRHNGDGTPLTALEVPMATIELLHRAKWGPPSAAASSRLATRWSGTPPGAPVPPPAGPWRRADRGPSTRWASGSVISRSARRTRPSTLPPGRRRGYGGMFVDANAVSVPSAQQVAAIVPRAVPAMSTAGSSACRRRLGAHPAVPVGPARPRGPVLSRRSALDARIAEGPLYAASAVKMAYAAWTKGSSALLLAARALARSGGVERTLLAEWALSQPALAERSEAPPRPPPPRAGAGSRRWRRSPPR